VIDWRTIAVVGLGAAIGGILRLLVTQLVVFRAGAGYAQYATMFINVGGSFLIGMTLEIAQTRAEFPPLWRYFIATGVLGGYTTFSTFSFEALTLVTGGFALGASVYIIGSVVLGVAAAFCGIAAARALAG